MSQSLWNGLAEQFCFKVSQKVLVKILNGAGVVKDYQPGASTRWSPGWQVLYIGMRTHCLTMWTSPQSCLNVLASWQEIRKKVIVETAMPFMVQPQESQAVPSAAVHWTQRAMVIQCRRVLHKDLLTRRQGGLGIFQRLATTVHPLTLNDPYALRCKIHPSTPNYSISLKSRISSSTSDKV